VTSYVRKYEPDTTYDETMAVYAGALVAQASTMWTGGLIEKRIGPRLTLLLGGYIYTAGKRVGRNDQSCSCVNNGKVENGGADWVACVVQEFRWPPLVSLADDLILQCAGRTFD
jgi:hypothetical protein